MPRPQYTQAIVADVISKIHDGTYPPKSQLPSVNQMMAIYKCSSQPVKNALRELQIRGFVEGQQGKGNFVVAEPPVEQSPATEPHPSG